MEATHRTSTPLDLRQPPFVRFLVLVEQWLDFLLSLPFADLVGVRDLEKLWCNFHQPLGLDRRDVMAVFSRRQHQLMVHDPFGVPVEQR